MLVNEPSLREALDLAFRRALDLGAGYLISCDADVLPYGGAVDYLLRMNERIPSPYFCLTGFVDDYLFPKPRPGGIRLYRCDYLSQAIDLIPGEGPRAESRTIRAMSDAGIPSAVCGGVVGVHDAEQYRLDLMRKSEHWAVKHATSLGELVPHLLSSCTNSDDYRVVLAGIGRGLQHLEASGDLAGFDDTAAAETLRSLGVNEKGALTDSQIVGLLAELPEARTSHYWATSPAPGKYRRLAELRHMGSPVKRSLASVVSSLLARLQRRTKPLHP